MLRGWNRTPPNVKNPITVCNTDFPTPTKEAVIAEHTEAHKNCENVRMHPEITNVMKTGMKPSSEIFLKIFLINLWNQIFQKCKRNPDKCSQFWLTNSWCIQIDFWKKLTIILALHLILWIVVFIDKFSRQNLWEALAQIILLKYKKKHSVKIAWIWKVFLALHFWKKMWVRKDRIWSFF